ncbi:hypothetical protein FB45DRAFT_890352 [Roridomyces roridus]|uniref:Uncharacterized protein n=1 Tax=Roridomyces roridus TaxID=1738132 RepID=A0AAD7G227_9AGAR|nr:hypothetical protein FB45DRAFT_890352 [Roridomyces roridus]
MEPTHTHAGSEIPSSAEPRLPLELEQAIFELVALSRPVFIPNLLLVASRVKQWAEPFLYRTLIIAQDKSRTDHLRTYTVAQWRRIHELRPSLLKSVRNLMLDTPLRHDSATLDMIFSSCPNVQNVCMCWAARASLALPRTETVDILPLRHLYSEVHDLVERNPFSRPFYRNISHLELGDPPAEEDWTDLVHLPQLTHIAFIYEIPILFRRLLDECKLLRALVVLGVPDVRSDYSQLATEKRFVMMEVPDFIGDWQRGVLDGNDYWARAEEFIARRITGGSSPDAQYPFYLIDNVA